MSRKRIVCGWILAALSAAIVIFIFYNSLQTASVSGAASGGLLERVNSFFARLGLPGISEKLLRKTAHLCEFGLLGILTSAAASALTVRRCGSAFSFAFCVAVAVTDEIIQYFVPGRACLVTDMMIDSAGAALGTLFTIAVLYIARRAHDRQSGA